MGKSSTMFLLSLSFIFMLVLTCTSDNSSDELELVSALNDNRQQQGLSNLTINPVLNCVATKIIENAQGRAVPCPFNLTKIDESIYLLISSCTGQNVDDISHTPAYVLVCQKLYTPTMSVSVINQLTDPQSEQNRNTCYNKSNAQVGVSFTDNNSGGAYFWCVTVDMGNSTETNTSDVPPPVGTNESPPHPTAMNGPPPPRCFGGSCNNAPVSTGYKRRLSVIGIAVIIIFVHLV